MDEKFTAMKDAITGAWDTVKEKTKETWDGIWADIKGIINMIIDGVENMANRVIDAINAMIDAVNEVADKIPGIGADLSRIYRTSIFHGWPKAVSSGPTPRSWP